MNRKLSVCLAATFVVASVLGTAGTASAATTLIVDGSDVSCSALASPFCTIQQGVNAAGPGTIVQVQPGTYTEQVTVPPGKDGLKLKANGAVTIQATNAMVAPGAIVRVTGSRAVRINGFIISGPSLEACGALDSGVQVDGGGKVFVSNDHITGIRTEPIGGCQFGIALRVGRNGVSPGEAVITHDIIDDYQKGGILVDQAGSNAFVRHVTVTGTPVSILAQNGIQVARGATAQIRDTTVQNNRYTGMAGVSASGILLFPNPGRVYLRDDMSKGNDVDVWLFNATGATIVGVTATNATENGFDTGGTSSGNLIKFVTASGSGGPDILDETTGAQTAGTANMYRHNTCGLSSPSGLCVP